ncbi:alpha/beta fold hydrolase [Dyadobacter crusticola]|uniref:alpha/beta fold hydrolase n=1 Tax=Dyadobacter crusticola TaxID=292407 RepID=UPI0004E0FD10|nr:alpha/beta hydrolase [Dyadobacter crusticola]
MQTIENDNTRLATHTSGIGDITLLFVHGGFIDKTYWKDQVAFFSERFKVVTLDLARHGESESERSDWTVESFGRDVIEVIKQLELTNVILIGHSLGAAAILEAGIAFPGPVIGFIAVDNFKDLDEKFPDEMRGQILAGLKDNFADNAAEYVRMGLVTPKTDAKLVERIVNAYRNAEPEMGYALIESIFNYAKREVMLLRQLPWTLHLLNSDYYPNNPDSLSNNGVQAYELEVIQATSHYPMLEDPSTFNQKLNKIIDKILAV